MSVRGVFCFTISTAILHNSSVECLVSRYMIFMLSCMRSKCSCRRNRYISSCCSFQYPRMPSKTAVPYINELFMMLTLASSSGTKLPLKDAIDFDWLTLTSSSPLGLPFYILLLLLATAIRNSVSNCLSVSRIWFKLQVLLKSGSCILPVLIVLEHGAQLVKAISKIRIRFGGAAKLFLSFAYFMQPF